MAQYNGQKLSKSKRTHPSASFGGGKHSEKERKRRKAEPAINRAFPEMERHYNEMEQDYNEKDNAEEAMYVNSVRQRYLKGQQLMAVQNRGRNIDMENSSLKQRYRRIDSSRITCFRDFPLSAKTQKGLAEADYSVPTEIQRQTIGLALQGHDVLGAAKTGSGKTLAFLIPILECLHQNKFGYIDGMGALVISPTRELAYQTYEVLLKVGCRHDFSAGLIIGGKSLKEEINGINRTHIIVCTPGRLQKHMEETVGFNADSLKLLVLDEADRVLEMGFADTMNAIFDYLPKERQTLMFSATQTKSVNDLARVGLKSPMFVSVHANAKHSTPENLEQNYIECKLHEKLNILWFFLKNHINAKILVFVQACKEARYLERAFMQARCGKTVMCLHGHLTQTRRVKVYEEFCRKSNILLFATDVAARGLDFPAVNWVIQYDAPENAETYIHRVGRTARYDQDGQALLFLLPSEKDEMLQLLEAERIPISEILINYAKVGSIQSALANNLVNSPQLKDFAKGCFVSYCKSIHLMKNKKMFDLRQMNLEQYAVSLGLELLPRIRFYQKQEKIQLEKKRKEEERWKQKAAERTSDDDELTGNLFKALPTDEKTDRDIRAEYRKEQIAELEKELAEKSTLKNRPVSKRELYEAMRVKGLISKKTVFDEDKNEDDSEEEDAALDIEAARKRMQEADVLDKEQWRLNVQSKHKLQKAKDREKRRLKRLGNKASNDDDDDDDEGEGGVRVVLGRPGDHTSDEEDQSDEDNSSQSEERDASDDATSDQSESESDESESSSEEESDNDDNRFGLEKPTLGMGNSLAEDEAFALTLLQGNK